MINKEFIASLPKCELHLHIEGTLEPELMFLLAERNKIDIKYKNLDEVKTAYNFSNLQDFLNVYYESASVLINEADFYDLTMAYLVKAHSNNVVHAEIFFDPQTHTSRGIEIASVINGIHRARLDAEEKFGITTRLIMCFLRDMEEESAFETLRQAEPFRHWIAGVGLDSAEVGNPPAKFENVFKAARQSGFLCVAHAGEEGPASYIWESLNLLNVDRIDHGNHSIADESLMDELAKREIALTMCPLSNLKLRVLDDLKKHPLKKLMERGVVVTINSDDPSYFGGYINENYIAISEALSLSRKEIALAAQNSFRASFLPKEEKKKYIDLLDRIIKEMN